MSDDETKELINKTITIISYGHTNKKPKLYPDSIVYDVRDFTEIDKEVSNEHDGTSADYQDLFTKTESNQTNYSDLFVDLKEKLLPIFNNSEEENIKVFVGGENGVHRSVAIAEMFARDLRTDLDSMNIENKNDKEIEISAEHRDIDLKKEAEEEGKLNRKNKKLLSQDRSRRRDYKAKRIYS